LTGFLHCAFETPWERFGQFLNDFLMIFSVKILIFCMMKIIFSLYKSDIFSMKNLDDFLYDFPNDS